MWARKQMYSTSRESWLFSMARKVKHSIAGVRLE